MRALFVVNEIGRERLERELVREGVFDYFWLGREVL